MARIYSQLALPPLQEQLSLLQTIDDHYTTHRPHYSMSRTYQQPDRLFHHHRNTSRSPSPVLISRNKHPRSSMREDRNEYRVYQEHHQYRESLPSFSSLLNGINQSTNQSIKFDFEARHSTPNLKPSSPNCHFPAVVFESRKRPRTSTHIAKIHSNSQTYSGDYRLANSTNPKISPLQSSPLSFTTQESQSPIHDVRRNMIENQGSQVPYSVGSWSPNSHVSLLDFPGKANPTPLKFDTEKTPSPRHRPEPKRLKVVEYQELSVHTSNYLKSPAAAQDSTNTKNGLGPKIWAGNRFLPQFTHEAYVPGEGTCYFYDDGTRCKSIIDGEVVNKYWGVTKTGKPRKRLAIACMTCREKKIKCDPDYPQCDQCKKFGRTCRFKNA
ncbi:hypothetical protein EPUL_005534 [Erysiphe pulchra]|uniref:Zn(2)-C6 fungal-type domain-containing protein n=1 Tax=Erysiphe pulchra TaxID=225359 RepID=A0A2S4PTX5_9PEZI|nr:hypothetical protein EPUL_005534 [Erysiphe pulchra]